MGGGEECAGLYALTWNRVVGLGRVYHVEELEDDFVWDAVVGESGHAAFLEGVQEVVAEGLALVRVEEGEVERHFASIVDDVVGRIVGIVLMERMEMRMRMRGLYIHSACILTVDDIAFHE